MLECQHVIMKELKMTDKEPQKRVNARKQQLIGSIAERPPLSKEITYTHPIFAQCFLPARKLKDGKLGIKVKHGQSILEIQAGTIYSPEKKDTVQADVPYGSAARIVLAHIQNEIIRAKDDKSARWVNMGDSLTEFLALYGFDSGGKRGKEFEKQVYNVAAMRATLIAFNDDVAVQKNMQISETIEFWREKKDPSQLSFWQPRLEVAPAFAESIRSNALPLDMRALTALFEKPKTMDVYSWFAYRLPYAKEKGEFIPYFGKNGLKNIFGTEKESDGQFKKRFIGLIKEVLNVYSSAKISDEDAGIRIYKSAPSVPHKDNHESLALRQSDTVFKSIEKVERSIRADREKTRRTEEK